MTKLTIDISAYYVYFIKPNDSNDLVVMLPVLAPLMDLTSYAYETFLDAFSHATCLCNAVDDDGFVGLFQVHHAFAVYQCVALMPLLVAALKAKEILVVPYCPTEGYTKGDMQGAKIATLSYSPSEPQAQQATQTGNTDAYGIA